MTKSNIVEKIENIIKIINNNINDGEGISKKNLEQSEVENLLYKIDDELAKLKKSAEGENKEAVEKKVRDLKRLVNEALTNEWGWARVKKFLGESLRSDLNELKDKLTELEIQNRKREEKLEEELAEVKAELTKKESLIQTLKQQLETKDRELENKKTNLSSILDEANKRADNYVNIAVGVGKESLPIVGAPAMGAIVGIAQGVNEVADITAYMLEKNIDNAKELAEKGIEKIDEARKDAKDFVEHIADNTKDLIDKGMDNAKDLIEKNLDVAQAAVDKGVGLEYKGFVIGAGMGRGNVLEAKVEGKVELIESLKEEVERLKKEIEEIKEGHKVELKDERERFAQELKEKTAEIERLQKQIVEQSDKTQENFLSVIEMVTKSSSKPSSRASTPPPAYNKQ